MSKSCHHTPAGARLNLHRKALYCFWCALCMRLLFSLQFFFFRFHTPELRVLKDQVGRLSLTGARYNGWVKKRSNQDHILSIWGSLRNSSVVGINVYNKYFGDFVAGEKICKYNEASCPCRPLASPRLDRPGQHLTRPTKSWSCPEEYFCPGCWCTLAMVERRGQLEPVRWLRLRPMLRRWPTPLTIGRSHLFADHTLPHHCQGPAAESAWLCRPGETVL